VQKKRYCIVSRLEEKRLIFMSDYCVQHTKRFTDPMVIDTENLQAVLFQQEDFWLGGRSEIKGQRRVLK
jgi:hypothetical protein